MLKAFSQICINDVTICHGVLCRNVVTVTGTVVTQIFISAVYR